MAIQRWLGRALAAAVLLVASACAEDLMMPPDGASAVKTYTPHSHLVRLVLGDLPPGTEYEVLAKLKAIKGGYGETADVQRDMADNARRIGADAIIHVKT